MLVDGEVMVHVELHHRDDTTELRHEASEHAGLVHPSQRRFRIGMRRQQIEKNAVRLGVVTQSVVDIAMRRRNKAQCFGMQEDARTLPPA